MNMILKIFKKIFQRKLITGIILILMIIGGYFGYRSLVGGKNNVRYVMAAVEKGTLIVSVSGSGQVSVLDQLDIKSKTSGEVEAVYIEKSEGVKAGKLIAKLDDSDAQRAVSDAERNLRTAKIQLEELYRNTLDTKQEAEDNLEKAHEDAFNTIMNAFLDLSPMIIGLHNITSSYEIADNETSVTYDWNTAVLLRSISSYGPKYYELEKIVGKTQEGYKAARKAYDKSFESYKNASRYSEKDVIEALLKETQETTKTIAELIKSETNLLDVYVDYCRQSNLPVFSKVSEYQLNLNSYNSKINNHLSSLLSVQRTIEDNKETKIDAEQDLTEMDNDDPNNLDIRTAKVNIQQKEDALISAKQELTDHYIYTPLGGIVADVKIKKGDSVSAGTALVSIITQQKIAEITLNEVDAAKVKTGQKTTLTFDALPELSISGKVIEVDTVGQVSQGVVSYGVKIVFDNQDERIKPGMSVTADIITDAKQDVLVLPSSAIKSQGDYYYVELAEAIEGMSQQLLANVSGTILPTPPKIQLVETGISNDLSTEIISGLKEGEIVVTSTIASNESQTSQSQGTQGFQIPGMSGQMRTQR